MGKYLNAQINKKVLLRERKRHTACRVASTPYVVLTGYPPPGYPPSRVPPWLGTPQQGTPWLGTPPAGYPPGRVPPLGKVSPWQSTPQAGYPPAGYPPHQGTPPAGPGRVFPLAAPWHSGKCCKALWDMGTPPVDRQTDTCQNITFLSYYVCGR